MRTVFLLSISFCLIVLGCSSGPKSKSAVAIEPKASVSTAADDAFLVKKLDDQAKAKALTEEGINEYQDELVAKGALEKVSEIREYFAVALRFDPANYRARQYLALVDNFKNSRLRQMLKTANAYLAKQKRKEREDFEMCVAVQTAARLDPSNPEVSKLVRDTSQVQANLIDTYLARSKASVEKANPSTSAAARDALYIDAYRDAGKAAQLDPQNRTAAGQLKSIRTELEKIFTRHAAVTSRLISAGKIDDAKKEIAFLSDLNAKLEGEFNAEIRSAQYSLNYQWARGYFAKKDYAQADAKAATAQYYKKTDEVAALRKRIADAVAQAAKAASAAAREASFDQALHEIDASISSGDLVEAKNRIETEAAATTDQSKLDKLDDRRDKVKSFLKDLYDKAVAAYRSENFKDSIELLQTIVQIDASYEQAADYLDKATAKQKLIEEY
jgi:hypothetical protein